MYREEVVEQDEDLPLPAPKQNRFYPEPKTWMGMAKKMARYASVVPNRRDRRRMGFRGPVNR